jgi:hypothetical protein
MALITVPIDGVIFSGGFNSDLCWESLSAMLCPSLRKAFESEFGTRFVAMLLTVLIKLTTITSSVCSRYIASLYIKIATSIDSTKM